MGAIPYAELHAFPDGDRPHTGNPAGVALLEAALDEADLLGVARSNNLSETAYLTAKAEPDLWGLRWFTPSHEVELCGHATLASAAWLFETGRVKGEVVRFDTLSGRLDVRRAGAGRYAMDFPAIHFKPADPAPGVVEAMGQAPTETHDIDPIHGLRYQMLIYDSEAAIAALDPDQGALIKAKVNVVATARGDSADFVSRFFAPGVGVPEDPVTGSAHCTLAPFWADRLGRDALSARQIGPRPGALEVANRGGDGRVSLIGAARLFLEGAITL